MNTAHPCTTYCTLSMPEGHVYHSIFCPNNPINLKEPEETMTNTVNMKDAVKGATVHFRCGGSAVVEDYELNYNHVITIGKCDFEYHSQGKIMSKKESPFDIIRIDPPAFDWSTVKPGMAFRYDSSKEKIWFFAHLTQTKGRIICTCDKDFGATGAYGESYSMFYTNQLTRTPEHDIEVQG